MAINYLEVISLIREAGIDTVESALDAAEIKRQKMTLQAKAEFAESPQGAKAKKLAAEQAEAEAEQAEAEAEQAKVDASDKLKTDLKEKFGIKDKKTKSKGKKTA